MNEGVEDVKMLTIQRNEHNKVHSTMNDVLLLEKQRSILHIYNKEVDSPKFTTINVTDKSRSERREQCGNNLTLISCYCITHDLPWLVSFGFFLEGLSAELREMGGAGLGVAATR